MTSFTPGPWRKGQEGNLRVYGPDGMGEHSGVVAEAVPKNGAQTANAHLIAAAPELYEALEMVRDADEDCKADGFPTMPATARAKIDRALAKARGES